MKEGKGKWISLFGREMFWSKLKLRGLKHLGKSEIKGAENFPIRFPFLNAYEVIISYQILMPKYENACPTNKTNTIAKNAFHKHVSIHE